MVHRRGQAWGLSPAAAGNGGERYLPRESDIGQQLLVGSAFAGLALPGWDGRIEAGNPLHSMPHDPPGETSATQPLHQAERDSLTVSTTTNLLRERGRDPEAD